jgi:hypothetical protein
LSAGEGNRSVQDYRNQELPSPLTSREQHSLLIDAQGVDDGLMTGEVEYEGSFGTLPLFDAARQARLVRFSDVNTFACMTPTCYHQHWR